jgi:hypothetical protein
MFFIRYSNYVAKRNGMLVLALACFFLGLFSKESAIVLLILIAAYDFLYQNYSLKDIFKNIFSRYRGFAAIAAFYLAVYIFVFPNQTVGEMRLMGGEWTAHLKTIILIFAEYSVDMILPFTVRMIPPLYAPALGPWGWVKIAFSLALVTPLIGYAVLKYKKHKARSFFTVWFLAGLVPVSNLIPLANPMAHRFLYLPSVGALALLAWGLAHGAQSLKRSESLPHPGRVLQWAVVGICMAVSIGLNMHWKSTFTAAREMVRLYPEHDKGHVVLGIEYYRRGNCNEAEKYFSKAVALNTTDPRSYHYLQDCQQRRLP